MGLEEEEDRLVIKRERESSTRRPTVGLWTSYITSYLSLNDTNDESLTETEERE